MSLLLILVVYVFFNIVNSDSIILQFYLKWDSHSTNELLSLICPERQFTFYNGIGKFNVSVFKQYYENYINSHVNEKHLVYDIIFTSDRQMDKYFLYIEYNCLKWDPDQSFHTMCNHYKYTAEIGVATNLNQPCIQYIHPMVSKIVVFNDTNLTLCSQENSITKSNNVNAQLYDSNLSNLKSTSSDIDPYDIDFFDISNMKLIITGCISSLVWTIVFMTYHLSLLNYPFIYHTKTAVFTLFLSCLANITLSTSLKDPYTFIPNAISVVLCMVHFSSWAYHFKLNIDAFTIYQFVTFNRNAATHLIKTPINNNIKTHKNVNYSNIQFDDNYNDTSPDDIPLSSPSPSMKPRLFSTDSTSTSLYSNNITSNRINRSMVPVTDSRFVQIFFMIFVMISICIHFTVVFITESLSQTDRFNFFSTLILFQWILCLTYLISWYQNYRFEYAIELLLSDGYSLNYLLGNKYNKHINNLANVHVKQNHDQNDKHLDNINSISPQPYVLNDNEYSLSPSSSILSNRFNHKARGSIHLDDVNKPLIGSNIGHKTRKTVQIKFTKATPSVTSVSSDSNNNIYNTRSCMICCCNGCCCCCRIIGVILLKLLKYLPWLILINASLWIYFGLFVCDIEVIWIQHTISFGVAFVYIIFSFCMNEKHAILSQETSIPMRVNTGSSENKDIKQSDNNNSDFNYVEAITQFKRRHDRKNTERNYNYLS